MDALITYLRSEEALIQAGIVVVSIVLAIGCAQTFRAMVLRGREQTVLGRAFDNIQPVFRPLLGAIFIAIGRAMFADFIGDDLRMITLGYEIAIAWGVVRLVRISTDSAEIIWFVKIVAVLMLAISFSGNFEVFVEYLDQFSFKLGNYTFSIVGIVKGAVAFSVLFWVAGIATRSIRFLINRFTKLRVSNRELAAKASQIAIYFLLFMVALDVIGIDLTALAVLGGAVGVGLGFGLQKITSNFISGLILLLEKTVEVNDVVELENGVYGHVRQIGARYTMIETLDTKEVLVPNEEFITTKVVNWTYTNQTGRMVINVGVHYNSDIHQARKVMLDAIKDLPRILRTPEPQCLLDEFGDSSVNFRLMFWVDDVSYKYFQVKSDVMFAVWDALKEAGIEIPFPQRDLHVRSVDKSILMAPPQPSQEGDKNE